MNDPHARNHALMSLIAERRAKVLMQELNESDALGELRAAEIKLHMADKDRLRSQLIEVMMTRTAVPVPAGIAGPLLSTAIEAFKTERTSTGAWTDKTEEMWGSRLRLLREWFGDVPVSSIAREQMTEFFNALKKLPKNAEKYKTSKGLGMRSQTQLQNMVLISESTVNQIMDCISGLFGWLDNDRTVWKVAGNIAKGLQVSKVNETKRVPFTPEDLRSMLSTPEWATKQFLHSYGYWLLPLACYTGARINELCQLQLSDFGEVAGHPVISFCSDGLRAKNASAERKVPIHPELIRLGLLRYVERLKSEGENQLFPECNDKRDGRGTDASRWFGKFKTRAGIIDARKVFHSFRHGFITMLLDKGADYATVVGPLVGHAGKGESTRTYWNLKRVEPLVQGVSLISYSVLHELLPVVEEVKFDFDVHQQRRRPPLRLKPISKRTKRLVRRTEDRAAGMTS